MTFLWKGSTKQEKIFWKLSSATLTHEQKLTCLANQADSLMEVLNLPEGLDELLNVPIDRKCICDLSEGHAPMRPVTLSRIMRNS